ncbi:MAG: HTTM domain-containing protein [Verrucomicrobiota bacterium]|nr:HTTM domain-containing protein [Verrucomicrobiota bacterium]
MVLEAFSLFQPSQSSGGQVPMEVYYTGPDIQFTFPYPGFEWLPLLSPTGMSLVGIIMGIAAICVTLGFCYRLSAGLVFLCWGYLYALESNRTYWMSYYYLELLITFLLIWMPAANRFSVDAWLRRREGSTGAVPYWCLFLLRAQLVITYFYAGVAKINRDWLLDAQPVRYFLSQPHVTAPFQNFPSIVAFLHGEKLAYFLSWTGAAFDLAVGFLLLAPRTRLLGMLCMLIFHGTNHFLLFEDIVWFPLVGITTAFIFLNPDWPERFWAWIKAPYLPRPDWPWLKKGALIVPGIGFALGWRSKPVQPLALPPFKLLPITYFFVAGWIAWQLVMPARHFLIPGDARITFEGLSFSWRLKAEVYRAALCSIYLQDQAIIQPGSESVSWNAWPGEKIIYQPVKPGQINWSALPEIVALYEPYTGERIIFNPLAGNASMMSEAQARERVNAIWKELYGKNPAAVHRTLPLSNILTAYARALQGRGMTPAPGENLLHLLDLKNGRSGDGQMLPVLRRVSPFGIEGEPVANAPFLIIEDSIVQQPTPQQFIINRAEWRVPGESRGRMLLPNFDLATRSRLPLFCLLQRSDQPPRIFWNHSRDLPLSKGMHISTQPFLLRRYARKVAKQWLEITGRYPVVQSETAVSLNFRPAQAIVDPQVDLATVPYFPLKHHSWVRDLEVKRIPQAN